MASSSKFPFIFFNIIDIYRRLLSMDKRFSSEQRYHYIIRQYGFFHKQSVNT
jgi:hypothetical protein